MAEMHNTANMNADEHQGALPPRVEEDAVTMRDQAAIIPASHVTHVGTNMYQVRSPRNNDVVDVDLDALKCGDRVGACDCGILLHNRVPFCQHIAAACKKGGHSVEDFLTPKMTTVGWQASHRDAPNLKVPTAAEINAHSALVNANLNICPCLPNCSGAPKKGKRMPGVFDLIQKPPKKKKNYLFPLQTERPQQVELQVYRDASTPLIRYLCIVGCVLLAVCLCNCGVL